MSTAADPTLPGMDPGPEPPPGGGLEGYNARVAWHRARGLSDAEARQAAKDAPSGDAPPRRRRRDRAPRSSSPRKPSGPRATGIATIRRRLAEALHALAGTATFVDPYIGAVIDERADEAAAAYAKLAEENDRVRLALERLTQGGIYGGAVFVTLAILAPILARVGLVPEPMRSIVLAQFGPKNWPPAGAPADPAHDRRGRVQPDPPYDQHQGAVANGASPLHAAPY